MRSAWEGFLPKNALVMARTSPARVVAIEHAEKIEAPILTHVELPTLESIQAALQNCTRCKLCEKRNTIVFGEGNPNAELMFVGEGPGENEDMQGRPFVGAAGQLLDRMIQAIGLSRDQVYIANVVKCRPPGNRNPEPDEVASCSPFLMQQIDAIRPKILVALGKFGAQTLMGSSEVKITKVRGTFTQFKTPNGHVARLMPTYHPAYLLRNPDSKKEAWEDLQSVARELGLSIPAPKKKG